jgi:hypothetical protein
MATETASGLTGHTRSVAVTTIASLGGVGAGVAAAMLANGPSDTMGLFIVFAASIVELGIMRVIGVDVSEFGAKDHIYVVFMTFALWFVTWGILLTIGVQ